MRLAYDSRVFLDHEYRPSRHFTPKNNWMNDPNGLVWHDGEYHLFFQHNPLGREWGHMSWGHAVSRDLINWEELPVAIPESDDGMIFSGSAISQGDEIFAFYTRHDGEIQSQCIARSKDNGRTFVKYENNPILDENKSDFRDPKVFKYQEKWIMCVAQPMDQQISFYSSHNLFEWTHLSNFGPTGAINGVWECPDLFPLFFNGEEFWVLLVSLNPGGLYGSGTQYFVGDFDGFKFSPRYEGNEPRWLDYGKDNYAGITFNNEPNNKRVLIGWMANWQDIAEHPETSWTSAMTIPRELNLTKYKEEIVLTQSPISDEVIEIKSDNFYIGEIGLTGFVKVGYNATEKYIFVDNYRAPYEAPDGKIDLKVIIDQASVELFTGDGVRSITLAVFPPVGTDRKLLAYRL